MPDGRLSALVVPALGWALACSVFPSSVPDRDGGGGHEGSDAEGPFGGSGGAAAPAPRLVVLEPEADTTVAIRAAGPMGGEASVRLTVEKSSTTERPLFRFALPSAEQGERLVGAVLRIPVIQSNATRAIGLARVLTPWSEAEATWFYASEGVRWTKPGVDYHLEPIAAAIVGEGAATSVWADLTHEVERLMQDPTGNLGFAVVDIVGKVDAVRIEFGSREAAALELRPRLTLELAPD